MRPADALFVSFLTAIIIVAVYLFCDNSQCPVDTVTMQGHEQTIVVPRLCEEDEALWWVADDVRGCVHVEEVGDD